MDKWKVVLEKDYGTGWYDGEVYTDIVSYKSETGVWYSVIAVDKHIEKLQDRIRRMQKRIDKLEGRI